MPQPGYDALADTYAATFPTAFSAAWERHAVEMFADTIVDATPPSGPTVVDVGCGIGHVAAHLARLGTRVIAVDPSVGMLRHAGDAYPDIDFRRGDAHLTDVDLTGVDAVLARFSLIHLPPTQVEEVLADWHRRLPPHATLLIAVQGSDTPGVSAFDHAVAPAWRWHPDTLAAAVTAAGFTETWRLIHRPTSDVGNRFPAVHLAASRTPPQR
ncbi:MAG: class I SAM-dependent methyltransferase [Gordonia sp. (in: high G+C Gram-positive bacteria)]